MRQTLANSVNPDQTPQNVSPHEGFQTHQCNISENRDIKRIQRWNNDEDSTARNNWNAEAKENQQLDSGGPDRASGTTRLTKKPVGRTRHRVWSPIRRRATKERRKIINRDWGNYHSCIWSGSTLFASNTRISIKHGNNKTTQTPLIVEMDQSEQWM